MKFFFMSWIMAWQLSAEAAIPLDGTFLLKKISCDSGSTGVLGTPFFEIQELYLDAGQARLKMANGTCKLSFFGAYKLTNPKSGPTVTLSFSSGTWEACSGMYPSSLKLQFAWSTTDTAVELKGSELFPLANCEGFGGILSFEPGLIPLPAKN